MFLQHPKVPQKIKQSASSIINIQNLITKSGSVTQDQKLNFCYTSKNFTELAKHFQALDSYHVIRLEKLEFLHLTLDGAYEDMLNSTITEIKYKPKKS